MKQFVVDASTTAAWCLPDEQSPKADILMDALIQGTRALAPSLWTFEVAITIWAACRRKRITETQSVKCFRLLKGLPIIIEHEPAARVFDAVWNRTSCPTRCVGALPENFS